MKNGKKAWMSGVGALVFAGALTGCGSPTPVQTAAMATPASYPAPDIQIVAQPVLASYNQKAVSRSADEYASYADESYSSRRRHHKHSHHKKAAQENPDSDLGLMAADDPKLLKAEIGAKESQKEDTKQWAAAVDKAPDGR